MPVEIERKFLVVGDGWRQMCQERHDILQGYFPRADGFCVRVRIIDGASAFLTIKGSARNLLARPEFEYPIPMDHARDMMAIFCGGQHPRTISKIRHVCNFDGHRWEIDEFLGRHAPLVVAEIELADIDEPFERPEWLGPEVTGDSHYSNAFLAGKN